jgi:hypothetical protein
MTRLPGEILTADLRGGVVAGVRDLLLTDQAANVVRAVSGLSGGISGAETLVQPALDRPL